MPTIHCALLAEANTQAGETFLGILPLALSVVGVLIVVHLAVSLIRRRRTGPRARWRIWELPVYVGTIASVALLGVTSFLGMVWYGVLDGWLLFVHMCSAGLFTAMLPLIAITWSKSHWCCCYCCQGSPKSQDAEATTDEEQAEAEELRAPHFFWLSNVAFWTLLLAGLTVTMTMLLSMLPVFGSDGLHKLLDLHRYSGLVVVFAVLVHIYAVVLRQAGLR